MSNKAYVQKMRQDLYTQVLKNVSDDSRMSVSMGDGSDALIHTVDAMIDAQVGEFKRK